MNQTLNGYLRELKSDIKEEEYQRSVRLSEENNQIQTPLFCEMVSDKDFSKRVADIAVGHLVNLTDVALYFLVSLQNAEA